MAFQQIAIIGQGLIGSSIARAARKFGAANQITATDISPQVRKKVAELGLALVHESAEAAVQGADLVIMCVPVGQYGTVAKSIVPFLKAGSIITDVGSVKKAVVRDVTPFISENISFIPSHPVAGTEQSGPESGFADLFVDRWCIITPPAETNLEDKLKLSLFWEDIGLHVEEMSPEQHDKVLALISHLPHLIAYTIVGTASHHEESTDSAVVKYAAGGFRDFTRIAASNPTIWRDIFLNNSEAVLEMVARFSEDLSLLVRAIRRGEGEVLFEQFAKSRIVRRRIVDAGQDTSAPDFGRQQKSSSLGPLTRPYSAGDF